MNIFFALYLKTSNSKDVANNAENDEILKKGSKISKDCLIRIQKAIIILMFFLVGENLMLFSITPEEGRRCMLLGIPRQLWILLCKDASWLLSYFALLHPD